MDIIQLYRDYNIPYKTEGHKHCREGWVNVPCPFCTGNAGYHLGWDIRGEYFVCWRCGGHSIKSTLITLLKIPPKEVYEVLRRYKGRNKLFVPEAKVLMHSFKLPSDCSEELMSAHRKYLEKIRKFDVEQLQRDWNIMGTGMLSRLDTGEKNNKVLDYSWRILIPIYWEGKMVSFTARSINPKNEQRYMACPENRELVNIKHTLYGKPEHWGDLGIGVEGCTDVWRLGPLAVGFYGIKYKPAQLRLVPKFFKRFPVVFDDDPQAVIAAEKLVEELKFRGVDSFRFPIKGDPGSMSPDDARHLVNELKTFKIH